MCLLVILLILWQFICFPALTFPVSMQRTLETLDRLLYVESAALWPAFVFIFNILKMNSNHKTNCKCYQMYSVEQLLFRESWFIN